MHSIVTSMTSVGHVLYITVQHPKMSTINITVLLNLMDFQVKEDIQQETKKGRNLIYLLGINWIVKSLLHSKMEPSGLTRGL